MDVGEQVGMTPEIIQKVHIFIFSFGDFEM